MSEKTFAGSAASLLDIFAPANPNEFMNIGADIFESEDLIERIYRVYLPLTADGFVGTSSGSDQYLGAAYVGGFYLPCTERVVLSGQIDLVNDNLPDYAGFVWMNEDCTFFCVQKIGKPPSRVAAMPFSKAVYACTTFHDPQEDITRQSRKQGITSALHYTTTYVCVMPSGALLPCINRGLTHATRSRAMAAAIPGFAAAINADNDRANLWNVKTWDRLIDAVKTPLVLGIDEEHVKSLFYMRSLPVTESGRRRPILHWARAHKRRIQEGIEIDVRKHLRGIEKFEMEGFDFEITNPRKAKVAA